MVFNKQEYHKKYYKENKKKILKQCKKHWDAAKYRLTPTRRYTYSIAKAKKRDINWKLSLEEFSELIKMPCYYCDNILSPPTIIGVGLDRINSELGYVTGNVVSCCKVCNRMKGDNFTQQETKAAAQAIISIRRMGDL